MADASCLCGAVKFSVTGSLRSVVACHCCQCRKTSGHYWAATSAPDDALTFQAEDGLSWYRASDTASRGFCKKCGCTLFWKPDDQTRTVISAGAFEAGSGLKLSRHVFVKDKGDYYEIADGLPQYDQFWGGENA